MNDETELRLIPLKSIVPSASNPRKSFDQDALVQLAESIRSKGVLEPILVRPAVITDVAGQKKRPGKKDAEDDVVDLGLLSKREPNGFELVAGERRWRAAQHAELKVIPALVRVLDDKAALEVQVIENDQREDVPPLEQARGYQRLIDLGDDAQTIAAKIGRPAKYVFARLQLTKLIEPLQQDLEKGRIGFGHAHLLARLTAADQTTARTEVVYEYGIEDDGAALPVDDLRHSLRQQFVNDLSRVPWNLDDAALVPEAGACTTCPKRQGQNPSLFDGLLNGEPKKKKTDLCLDGPCYRGKAAALVQVSVRAAEEKHGAAPVMISTGYGYSGRDREAAGGGEILTPDTYEIVPAAEAKDAKDVKPAVVAAGDGIGKIVQVRLKTRRSSGHGGGGSYSREEAKRRERSKVGKQAAVLACAQVAAETFKHAGKVAGWPKKIGDILRACVLKLCHGSYSDALRLVAKRRNLSEKAYDHAEKVAELAEAMNDPAELLALLSEILAADKATWWGNGHWSGNVGSKDKDWWATWGVDHADCMKRAAPATAGFPKKAKGKKRAKAAAV